MLEEGANILDVIKANIKSYYLSTTSICFLENEDAAKLMVYAKENAWNTYNSSQLKLLITLKVGILILNTS